MFFCVSLQGVPQFLCHSHQTNLGVCEILVLGNPLLKSERVSLKTVQLINMKENKNSWHFHIY